MLRNGSRTWDKGPVYTSGQVLVVVKRDAVSSNTSLFGLYTFSLSVLFTLVFIPSRAVFPPGANASHRHVRSTVTVELENKNV